MTEENWGMPKNLYGMQITRVFAAIMADVKKAVENDPKIDWSEIFVKVEPAQRIPLVFVRYAFIEGIRSSDKRQP